MNGQELFIRISDTRIINASEIQYWHDVISMRIYADGMIRAVTQDTKKYKCLDYDGNLTGYWDPSDAERTVALVCAVEWDHFLNPTVTLNV